MRGLSAVHFSSGEVIFRQGDLSEALYFILGPTADPGDGHDDEYVMLTTETNDKEDEAEGGGGESKRGVPFIPSRRFFGEEGLVYRCVCANDMRIMLRTIPLLAKISHSLRVLCTSTAC